MQRGDIIINSHIEKLIGNNIKLLREKAGMTQEMLAAKLQVSGCSIAKIEVGQRHLYPDEILLIKQILRVEYEDIFKVSSKK